MEVLLTGGLGDVIAIESFWTDEMRQSLETIYLATPAGKGIIELFNSLPNYPKLKGAISLWDDWSNFKMILNKWGLLYSLSQTYEDYPTLDQVEDWSFLEVFKKFKKGKLPYQGSSFIKHELTAIPELPERFALIHPQTTDRYERMFTEQDWEFTLHWLEDRQLQGVVVGQGRDDCDARLLNLVNRTSLVEAIEVTKRAHAFIGMDSLFSVLASKVVPKDRFIVKTTQQANLEMWAPFYYAPMSSVEFLTPGPSPGRE